MLASGQTLMLHSLVARDAPLAMDLRIAKELGYDGVELGAYKMRAMLDAGWSEAELAQRLAGTEICSLAFLFDVDRHGADESALIDDVNDLIHLAKIAGAKGIQVITGPVSLDAAKRHSEGREIEGYKGVIGLEREQQLAIVSTNLARIADMAAAENMDVYFEALGWCPLNTLADQVELVERTGKSNMKLIVDFWLCYVSGDTPEDVAALDPQIIGGVHMCDSLAFDGGIPDEPRLRNVGLGDGVLDLQAWVDATKSTGYVGWWSGELFCRRQHQDDSFEVGTEMKNLMTRLIEG